MTSKLPRIAALAAIVALGVASAPALAVGPPAGSPNAGHVPGTSNKPDATTPSPAASPKAKAKAYGTYCADQSKKHVAGTQGTPFSRCVNAMAKLASGQTTSPAKACKTESKKRVAGEKGTSFSRCVKAAAKLRKDRPAA